MPDAPPDLTGQTLGDFHVLRRIGAGGMGQVYLARQLSLKREVALKFLNPELAENTTALQRFQAEAEAVARISHPNIVQVYALGEHAGRRFMALEYVDGRNLRDYVAKKGPPDLPVAVTIIRQICQALQRAGELGIVHRDIKPDNILVTRRGEVKVADFGLSRLTTTDSQPLNLTQSGTTVGTPLYMAPEQVRGLPTDTRTDLYALGATAYHLLAGVPPFTGATAFEVAMKHANDPPPPLSTVRPDLPPGLVAVVHKLLAKAPAERYQTARDVLRDLARLRENKPVSAELPVLPTVSVPTPVATPRPMGRWLVGATVAAVGFTSGWLGFGRADRPASTAVAGPGLPDARLPDGVALLSARERALSAKLNDRQATLTDIIQARAELGLLQLRERRFEAAEETFAGLEKEKTDARRPGRLPVGPPVEFHLAAAKFGQGIVLAHRDKPDEALKAFDDGLKLFRVGTGEKQLEEFLFRHPELALASAEALDRAAEEKKLAKLQDPRLERLRALRPAAPAGKK